MQARAPSDTTRNRVGERPGYLEIATAPRSELVDFPRMPTVDS
jgi:hypothetical protein